jgi:cyanophycin synthetase
MTLARNRAVLWALYLRSLARAFFRFKDGRRREAAQHVTAFYERAWRDAAVRLGATFEPLGSGVAEIARGGQRTWVLESTTAIDNAMTHALASQKPVTYRLLARSGLPVPPYAQFTFRDLSPAFAFLESAAGECVVKPACGTGGGRGVTTGIRTRWQLARATAAAAVYGDDLLIEEQVEGENYRLLYLDGVLLDAFVRRPPYVIADGRSTVGRLVRLANAARLRHGYGLSQGLLTVDLDMKRTLEKRGLSLHSIPAEGTVVTLKTVINENCGSDNTSATHLLCRAIVDAGAKAARTVGVRLAGIDVITGDPGVALEESGGVINEVNTPPNYYYHYHKRDGAFPVAVHLLERLLAPPARHLAPVFEGAATRRYEACSPW